MGTQLPEGTGPAQGTDKPKAHILHIERNLKELLHAHKKLTWSIQYKKIWGNMDYGVVPAPPPGVPAPALGAGPGPGQWLGPTHALGARCPVLAPRPRGRGRGQGRRRGRGRHSPLQPVQRGLGPLSRDSEPHGLPSPLTQLPCKCFLAAF